MALATRPKPNAHHCKRVAQHHRHTRPYLKTYWPYLPTLAILAGGAVINRSWVVKGPALAGANGTAIASRLQILSGSDTSWLTSAILLVAAAALALFLIRHTLAFHRVVIRGERFINNHPLLDIAAALVFTAGFILTNTNGLVR